ncbi:MAG: hypothetical protein ACI8T1_001369 [Verrucomicrobiales bacterium]|jgi:hypothetical protein
MNGRTLVLTLSLIALASSRAQTDDFELAPINYSKTTPTDPLAD